MHDEDQSDLCCDKRKLAQPSQTSHKRIQPENSCFMCFLSCAMCTALRFRNEPTLHPAGTRNIVVMVTRLGEVLDAVE
jgi:hypothetical protein